MKKRQFPVINRLSILLIVALGIAQSAIAQESEPVASPGFGGPNAVENQIADDSESWVEWKTRLKDEYGLAISGDYTSVLLYATASVPWCGSSSIDMHTATPPRFLSRWARWATSVCRNLLSTTPTSGPRTFTGGSA
jgi:hypothetical protein